MTTSSISTRKAKVISVSTQFIYSIIATMPINVKAQDTTLAKLELIISDTVSMSLVKRLIRSPDWWVSKYLRGRAWSLLNRSCRRVATVRWEMRTIRRE